MKSKIALVLSIVLSASLARAAGTSEILPFATSNANVLSQSEYLLSAERLSGNVPGTRASAALNNKALRQCSAMAGVLAKFIADHNDTFTVIDSPLGLGTTVIAFEDALADTIPAAVTLATPTETRTNVCPGPAACSTKAVTPEGLATLTATQTRAGIAKTATNADLATGTDDAKMVTPKQLVTRTANSTRVGLVELATDLEAIAGTDDTRAVTPFGLDAALDDRFPTAASSLANPGYTTLPSGIILQWGFFTSTGNPPQLFPIAFPTATVGVQMIANDTTDVGVSALSASGFTPDCGASGKTVRWLAVGY